MTVVLATIFHTAEANCSKSLSQHLFNDIEWEIPGCPALSITKSCVSVCTYKVNMNTEEIRGQKASGQAQESGPDFHKNWNHRGL